MLTTKSTVAYASNMFPRETYSWNCDDEGLFFYGQPLSPLGNASAATFWSIYTDPSNPFTAQGFKGNCEFPQITRGGLDDSWQHGRDLYEVYHDTLHFLPRYLDNDMSYRVTNNVITSQVAGMVVNAMTSPTKQIQPPVALKIQQSSVDSLEPTYSCPAAAILYSSFGPGSTDLNWTAHLEASQRLFEKLDSVSGIAPDDNEWHQSWDHYFDSLSSRLCHAKPLPCNMTTSACITEADAERVFRLGQWEYSYLYRAANASTLEASVASFGVWVAELVQNIRNRISGVSSTRYRHNVAHDGSLARLLSILQVDVMVWPGMGAEVVFELYRKNKSGEVKKSEQIVSREDGSGWFVRVLWGGAIFRSSHPDLGLMDMLPVTALLKYLDSLVGVGASLVPGLCA